LRGIRNRLVGIFSKFYGTTDYTDFTDCLFISVKSRLSERILLKKSGLFNSLPYLCSLSLMHMEPPPAGLPRPKKKCGKNFGQFEITYRVESKSLNPRYKHDSFRVESLLFEF